MAAYDRYPKTKVQGWGNTAVCGCKNIVDFLQLKLLAKQQAKSLVIAVDTYPGVNDEEVLDALQQLKLDRLLLYANTSEAILLNGGLPISTS